MELQYTGKKTSNGVTSFSWDLSYIVKKVSLPEVGQLENIVRMKITGRELSDLQNTYENLLNNYKELDEEWNSKLELVHGSSKELSDLNESIQVTTDVHSQLQEQVEEQQRNFDEKSKAIEE
ncbi:hypothetical protein QTO02_28890, partial [Vibrio fortis]